MAWVPVLPLSAREGQGVPKLLDTLLVLFDQLTRKMDTGRLNRAVEAWVASYPPPVGPRTRFKLRYAVQSGINPVKFICFVSRPDAVPGAYLSYLKNKIRSDLGFLQIPIDLELRGSSSWRRTGGRAVRSYSIGDLESILGEKPHVLRYWEQENPSLPPGGAPPAAARIRKPKSWRFSG
jgi:hypothetical protein